MKNNLKKLLSIILSFTLVLSVMGINIYATADLNDVNMIDPFHLDAYGTTAVNYNRDVEIFPVLPLPLGIGMLRPGNGMDRHSKAPLVI